MPSEPDSQNTDPVFLHAKKESLELLLAFLFFFGWSVGTSYTMGYGHEATPEVQTVLGMPRWVFWGVAAPWLGALAYTIYFCTFRMADDPLGEVADTASDQQGGRETP